MFSYLANQRPGFDGRFGTRSDSNCSSGTICHRGLCTSLQIQGDAPHQHQQLEFTTSTIPKFKGTTQWDHTSQAPHDKSSPQQQRRSPTWFQSQCPSLHMQTTSNSQVKLNGSIPQSQWNRATLLFRFTIHLGQGSGASMIRKRLPLIMLAHFTTMSTLLVCFSLIIVEVVHCRLTFPASKLHCLQMENEASVFSRGSKHFPGFLLVQRNTEIQSIENFAYARNKGLAQQNIK